MLGTIQGIPDYLVERGEPSFFLFLFPRYKMLRTLTCDFFEGKEHVLFLHDIPDKRSSAWKGLLCLK